MASTYFFNFSIPASACAIRFLPSQLKGLVTKAIVKIPKSLAICATTGAAPVPVPPPIPAVINNISVLSRALVICSLTSNAAFSPIFGSAPHPSPFVVSTPNCNLFGTSLQLNTCKSVFINQKSTPASLAWNILFTAFPPPPPTPATFILVGFIFGLLLSFS